MIVPIRVNARLQITPIDQQRSAIESGAQARYDGAVDGVVGAEDGEGPAVAAEDVCGGGLGIGAVVAGAGEGVVGDAASDTAGGGLRVDRECVGGIVVPDGIDVLSEIVLERVGVQRDVVYRCDDAERFAGACGLAEVAPRHAVSGCLCG